LPWQGAWVLRVALQKFPKTHYSGASRYCKFSQYRRIAQACGLYLALHPD
jgi:hypothetical protein